jgi:hypothetical protein
MIRLMNRASLLGLALFILPTAFFAETGPIEKGEALRTLVVSLSGLAVALVSASYVILRRRMERFKE